MANETKERIIKILDMTFAAIDNCYKANDESKEPTNYSGTETRLIFPCYYRQEKEGKAIKDETRISEQELRFLFIEQFNKYCAKNNWDAYYSIETPTRWKYRFSGEEKPPTPHRVKKEGEKGESAMVDVCIHDNEGKRICLIEFKFGNPEKFCFEKDLVKLEEEGVLCFFVHLLKSQRRDTLPSILNKIKDITTDNDPKDVNFSIINYVCHTLPKGGEPPKPAKTEFISESMEECLNWTRIVNLPDESIQDRIDEILKDNENRKSGKQKPG